MKNWTAIIPARSGSKGIPNKNIKLLGDKPLMAWSIEQAIKSDIFKYIYVSTDSIDYAAVADKYGAEVLLRPDGISMDHTPMVDVLAFHAKEEDIIDDNVMLLQPTSPFRTMESIIKASEQFQQRIDNDELGSLQLDSLISIEEVPEKYNPAQMMEIDNNLLVMTDCRPVDKRIKRRQDFPKAYMPTGSIYCMRRDLLLRDKPTIYGESVGYMIEQPMININNQDDWNKAEQYIKNK